MLAPGADIVIVGGGPGGLAAAETAARRGASVIVLEQTGEIGSPTRTSGGSFIPALRALRIPEGLYHPIRRCRFVAPGNQAVFEYDDPVLCIIDVRGVFQLLAERAIAAGAQIRVATTGLAPILEAGAVAGVRARKVGGREYDIPSRVLIDATGYHASLIRQAGVHPGYQRFGVGAEYDLYAPHCDQDEAILIVGGSIAPSGYAWLFPWGRGRVRVGVGVIHADSNAHPEPVLDQLVARAAEFGANLANAQPVEYHFGLIPSDGLADSFTGNGILAVGDAAGQASALVGEGIRWAIKAGQMAGAVAAEAVEQNDCSRAFLARYEKRWRAAHGRNLRIAHEINRRIARWDDERWNEKTELLKLLSPDQFSDALQSNFVASWLPRLLLAKPRLWKEGFRELASLIG